VWSSADGVTWTQAANAPWSARRDHTSVVFDNRLWVIGGWVSSYGGVHNDVWFSEDGGTWTQATANAPWFARSQHTSVVFDNRLWVIGGNNGSRFNDMWSYRKPQPHTADLNANGVIELSELLRLVQLLNAGGFGCQEGTEDGYAPNAPNHACIPHSSDYLPQDWKINLQELLRLIQFFNTSGYHYCPDSGTEDSYCPGPPLAS
jgi:hypothetical protein